MTQLKYWNGSSWVSVVLGATGATGGTAYGDASQIITGQLAVANGGTGSNNASGARANLAALGIADNNKNDFQPTVGLDIYPRLYAQGVAAHTNGVIRATSFTPTVTTTVNTVTAYCTTAKTSTASTTEFGRFALATYDGNTTYNIISFTPQSTTHGTATGAVTATLDTSVTLNAGTTYAVLFFWYSNGTVTVTPQFLGYVPSQVAAISFLNPKLGTSLTAQTDINGGVAGTFTMGTAAAAIYWARLSFV
jgi:hypothetical protein